MVSKAELRKNKVAVAILIFICVYGLFYMINWGHKSQEEAESNDKEIK